MGFLHGFENIERVVVELNRGRCCIQNNGINTRHAHAVGNRDQRHVQSAPHKLNRFQCQVGKNNAGDAHIEFIRCRQNPVEIDAALRWLSLNVKPVIGRHHFQGWHHRLLMQGYDTVQFNDVGEIGLRGHR